MAGRRPGSKAGRRAGAWGGGKGFLVPSACKPVSACARSALGSRTLTLACTRTHSQSGLSHALRSSLSLVSRGSVVLCTGLNARRDETQRHTHVILASCAREIRAPRRGGFLGGGGGYSRSRAQAERPDGWCVQRGARSAAGATRARSGMTRCSGSESCGAGASNLSATKRPGNRPLWRAAARAQDASAACARQHRAARAGAGAGRMTARPWRAGARQRRRQRQDQMMLLKR